jgi:hypothetical protein
MADASPENARLRGVNKNVDGRALEASQEPGVHWTGGSDSPIRAPTRHITGAVGRAMRDIIMPAQ